MEKEKLKEVALYLKQFRNNIEYTSPEFPGMHTMVNGGAAYPIIASALRSKETGIAVVYGKNMDSATAAGILKKYVEKASGKILLVPINSERSTDIKKRKFPLDISLVIVLMDEDTRKIDIENRLYKPFPILYLSTSFEEKDMKDAEMLVYGEKNYTLCSMMTIILNSTHMVDKTWFKREIMTINAFMIIYSNQDGQIYGENEYLLYEGISVEESMGILGVIITGDFYSDLLHINKEMSKYRKYKGEKFFSLFPNDVCETSVNILRGTTPAQGKRV